jgi:hypothetical protein
MKKLLQIILLINTLNLLALPSQTNLNIPEPMIFDLVRPLGSTKGELELNILTSSFRRDSTKYSPEIEYEIIDGLGIEAELGIVEEHVSIYKIAMQDTFAKAPFKNAVHGWQIMHLYDSHINRNITNVLYLLASRIYGPTSGMFMIGAETGQKGGTAFVFNPTLFYNVNHYLSLGFENNIHINKKYHILSVPQVNLLLDKNWSIQLGVGQKWQTHHHREHIFAFRLIYSIVDHPD